MGEASSKHTVSGRTFRLEDFYHAYPAYIAYVRYIRGVWPMLKVVMTFREYTRIPNGSLNSELIGSDGSRVHV